jgi:hypothetical protein
VEAPGEAVGALLVGLHAAHHGLTLPKPLQDLERALARLDDGTWRQAAEMARSLGAEAEFAAGLSLRPQGAAVAGRLGLDAARAKRAVRLRGAAPAALVIEWLVTELRTRSTFSDRARVMGRLLVPSREWMLQGYPLARRGPAGMAAAYLVRPIRVARMVPSALWTWLGVALPARTGRRWRRLPRVAAAAVLLAAARAALRLVPFRLIVRAAGLGEPRSAADVAGAEAARAAEISDAVGSAASRLPWNSTCLARAVAGAVLLRWHRLPAVLHLGVLRDGPSGQITAHAWLTCGSHVLTGGEGHERFTEIAAYSSR